jgi:Domain of unknown function (DUF3854)
MTTKENRPGEGAAPINDATRNTDSNRPLSPQHADMLTASGITPEHAQRRGYETIRDTRKLAERGITFPKAVTERGGGLLVPMLDKRGSTWGHQFRPNNPRERRGKLCKYETPTKQRNRFDIPPGVGPQLDDPTIPLFITEGVKKADCAAQHGLACISIQGVWAWRGTNPTGGTTAIPDFNDIAFNDREVILGFDGDVARKPAVQKALRALADYLGTRGAHVKYLHLPDTDDKTGLDDYLTNGHTVEDLWSLVKSSLPPVSGPPPETAPTDQPKPTAQPVSLAEAHTVFKKWLGDDYDTDALDAMLAVTAVEKFDDGSDPAWLLLVSGPGNAKTETVQALDGIGATVTSAISSEAALLSATPQRERSKDATGGLLRKIGDRGVLVVKDVTSILSMDRNIRGRVLSAFREIYDGRWYREVGTDGGLTIPWQGRIVVIGAVTTAWDTAHAVISTMGDRFVLVRMDSTVNRQPAGRKAIGNTGDERTMRAELSAAVAGVIAGMNATAPAAITDDETNVLLAAADLVTLARTGVEYDYRGDVIDAHAPEMPTRFAKQLAQIVRGGTAIGMMRAAAVNLAIRCARDSMPPLRLAILTDVAEHPDSTPSEVRKRLNKPRATVDRQLQALHMLSLVELDEVETISDGQFGKKQTQWHYTLVDGVDPGVLAGRPLPEMLVDTPNPIEEENDSKDNDELTPGLLTHISGNGRPAETTPEPPEHATKKRYVYGTGWVTTGNDAA